MNICIIGAGITGLTLGRQLSSEHNVVIYEKEANVGGIARAKNVNGITYHTVGGHCLNSKNQEIMNLIFDEILPKDDWHCVKRDAKINFKNHFISYPIEFSIQEIAKFDEELAFRITNDFFMSHNDRVENLADWFREMFGTTLAEEYFIPYNRKIWQMEPSQMSHSWIDGKLPLPNKKDFFKSLIANYSDSMPHSTFYYPNTNTQNTFIDALSKDLNIVSNFEVISVEQKKEKWIINGQFEYDMVINTMPLNILPFILKNVPIEIQLEAKKLKYNKVTTMLWRTNHIDFTWSYYPSADTIFHRHIHIGNFFNQSQNYTITESMGEHSYEEMVEYGKRFNYLLEPIDYHISDYAYVVYDQNYAKATKVIKDYLSRIGLFTVGRFGEWEYYNMDICMESAIKLSKKIMKEEL